MKSLHQEIGGDSFISSGVNSVPLINLSDEKIRKYLSIFYYDSRHGIVGAIVDQWEDSGKLYQHSHPHVLALFYRWNIYVVNFDIARC
jgi:hypothetical protein